MRKILPKILAVITGHDRYLPEFEWCGNSWTYNIFRVYELIFFRRVGIKREMTANNRNGKVTYQTFTLEATLALGEMYFREWLKGFNMPVVKVWMPILSNTTGLPLPTSPFLLAIALDTTSATHTSTTPHTYSYTVTGSAPLISTAVTVVTQTLSSSTYNGTTITNVTSTNPYLTINLYLNVLGNPSTGAHNVVNTYSANPTGVADEYVSSYSGCNASEPDAFNSGSASASSSITVNTTVVQSNCWLNGVAITSGNTYLSNSANTTIRVHSDGVSGNEGCIFDSNGTVGTGSQASSLKNTSGTAFHGMIVMSIKQNFNTFAKSVSASVSNSVSRLATVSRLVTYKRVISASVSNAVSRLATVTKLKAVVRTASVSVSNSVGRLASIAVLLNGKPITLFKKIAKPTAQSWSKITKPTLALWNKITKPQQ